MTTQNRTIYRSDHPGSFIRPTELRKARIDRANGRISEEELTSVTNAAILNVLDMQRQAEMPIFSDGEFRRKFFFTHFQDSLEGIDQRGGPDFERFPRLREVDPDALPEFAVPRPVVVGPLKLKRHIAQDEVAFMKENSPGPFKITMPSPVTLGVTGSWF